MLILSFLLPLLFMPSIPRQEPYDDVPNWGTGVTVEGEDDTFLDNITLDDVTLDLNWSIDPSFTIAIISPADPPRYWRNTAYDRYLGTDWQKSNSTTIPLNSVTPGSELVYTIIQNITHSGVTGSFPLLSLWPTPLIISDSIQCAHLPYPNSYDLVTDEYSTAILNGRFSDTGSTQLQYQVTFNPLNWTIIRPLSLSASATPTSILTQYQQQGLSYLSTSTRVDIQNRLNAILAGVPNTAFEQAFAIMNYFKTAFTFDPFTPRPGSSDEHVEWFLQQSAGVGIDFATAYTLFLRQNGIAARPVFGAVLGEDQGTRRVLHLMHAHFWVEVYIPTATQGYWLQFDPTPLPSFITDGSPPPEPPDENPPDPSALDQDPYVISTYYELSINVIPLIVDRFEQFQVIATLTQDGNPEAGETINFYDVTENWFIGSNVTSLTGEASITFEYNNSAIIGFHLLRVAFQAYSEYSAVALHGSANLSLSASPLEVNRTMYVHFNGTLRDAINGRGISFNETGYTGVSISLNSILATEPLTNALGRYSVDYLIPSSQSPLGLTQAQAAFLIPSVIDLAVSSIEILNITARSQLTIQADPNSIRVNSSVVLQGRLRYENGTGIPGQTIQLVWNSTPIGTTTTGGSGYYTQNYTPTAIGQVTIQAQFNGATNIYGSRAINTARVHEEGALIIFVDDEDGDDVTQRGGTVYFSGWVEDQNGTRQGGVPVLIYFNQTSPIQTTTNSSGFFWVSYQVEASRPVGRIDVTGDIIHATLQVVSSIDYFTINSSTQIQALLFDRPQVMRGEAVTLTGQIIDDQGAGLATQSLGIDLSYSSITIPIGTVVTQPGGSFSFMFIIPGSIPGNIAAINVEVMYLGTTYYGSSADMEVLDIFSNATLLIEVPPGPFAWNASISVNGTLVDNFGRALLNREIFLFVNGSRGISTASNQAGQVSFRVQFMPSGTNATTYTLQLRHETIITINSSIRIIIVEAQQPMQPPPFPYFPIELILPIIAIVIIIVVAILVYRYWKRRPRQPTAPSIDAAAMLTALRQLLTDKKYRESIIYAFRMFETIVQARLGVYRDPSITVREFANLTVAHGRLDTRTMEVFIRGVEEARYSDHPISYNTALSTLNAFANLYNSLTGGNLRFVTQEQQPAESDKPEGG